MKKLTLLLTLFIIGCGQANHQYQQKPESSKESKPTLNNAKHVASNPATDGVVALTGRMAMGRAAHTATLLKNGQVLVCGGFSGNSTLASAEMFNPATQSFTQVGNMTVPRSEHSATLLPDGTVLIAGGYNGTYLTTAEIFNPATGTFTPAGSMTIARSGHTATMLNNRQILLAGGVGEGWSFLQSAALFDIHTGRFTATGAMTTARESHTATLLNNGTVLITGGHKDRRSNIKIYSSAEIYNPSSGTFTVTGSMTTIRHKHDAVKLNEGNVLIIGGSDERDSRGAYRSVEVYHPAAATFQSVGNMNLSRYKHNGTSTLLHNGNVLIAGGANRAEIFKPNTTEFALVAGSMQTDRLFSCATHLVNSRVLITGGYDENQHASANAWLYTYNSPNKN